jgi:hypothetical protein
MESMGLNSVQVGAANLANHFNPNLSRDKGAGNTSEDNTKAMYPLQHQE